MLRDLITWVLNTYLGKYLENLNSAQLSVALLSGEVELENIPIRKDALRSFGLPIEVSSGSIRKIKLSVPVRQFRTSPWCISVEGLFCVICPKDLDNWDDAKEKLVDLEYKLSVLDTAEANWRSEKGQQIESYYFSSYNNWLKYGTNMATNIIDNIELKIFDVHFRYEDSINVGNSQIAAGIKIGSLTAQSCDINWIAGSNRPVNNEMNYKIVELNELSLYWDNLHEDIKCQRFNNQELLANMSTTCELRTHRFIIKPICATARWKREKCQQVIRSKDRPRVSCELLVPEVIISLSDVQHGQIMDKLEGIRQIKEIRAHRLKRPNDSVIDNPKIWWKYVLNCHGVCLKSSEEKFLTLRENLQYMRLYQRIILNPSENLSNEDKSFKSYIESDRNISDLIILRRICFEKVFTKGLSLKSHNIKGKSMLFHWFPNWMGWYGSSNSSVQNAEQDETLKNLEDDIMIALEHSLQNSSDLKRDTIFGYFTIDLLNGLVILHSENSTSENSISMEMQFNKLSSFLQLNPLFTSYAVGISLGEIYLIDKTNNKTKHPYLIKPQVDNSAELVKNMTKSSSVEPLFQMRYENDNQVQLRLKIKSKSLDITYNNDAVEWFVNFFTKSTKRLTLKKKKSELQKNNNFIKNWNQLFIGNEANRNSWTFEIEVFAPRIIFLENYKINNSLMILMDFGKFQMLKTDFQKKTPTLPTKLTTADDEKMSEEDDEENFMTPCSTPPASEKSSGSESPTIHENSNSNVMDVVVINKDTQLETALHSKIYNKYTIHLTDLQVLVCKYQERWQASLKNSSNFHLIDKFNIALTIEHRTVFTSDPEYPAFTLFGTLPTILIHGNEENINQFFSIMYPITRSRGLGNKTSNEEKQTSSFIRNETDDVDGNRLVIEFAVGQMIIEMQSKERSIAELQIIGARAGLIKTAEETTITMSVHGLLLVDAIQSFGPDFELLVASHRHVGMDSLSGSLKHSSACSPVTPSSPDPLAYQRPTSPHIITNALRNIQQGTNSICCEEEGELNALISVEIKMIPPNEKNSVYLQTTNIAFNNLDIIANQDTILELMDFTKRTILNQKIFENINSKMGKNPTEAEPKESEEPFSHSHNEIVFDFFRLNILILYTMQRDNYTVARKVGTLTMSEAKIYASIQSEVSLIGSLGGIQVIDITPEGVRHQRILSVGRDPVSSTSELNRQSMLNKLSNEIYCHQFDEEKYDQMNALNFKIQWSDRAAINIHVRMASVWYTHCPRFLQDLNVCITHFKRSLRQFVTSIGNKASDMAKEFVQQIKDVNYHSKPMEEVHHSKNSLLSFDVIINSPVIVLPISNESSEVLVANLGKISCCNNDHRCNNVGEVDNCIETYTIEIRNINLFSLNIVERKEDGPTATLPKAKDMYSCKNDAIPILHDTAISLKISRGYNESITHERQFQTFSVEGSMVETLRVSLYRKQYEQLIDSVQNATNFSYKMAKGHVVQDLMSSSSSVTNANMEEDKSVFTTIKFSVPVLEINLQNEYHETLINVIFKDFNVNHEIKGTEKNLEVILKSVLMEDLKSELTSPFRNMVTSINLEKGSKKKEQPSSSCPDLSNLCSKHDNNMSTSMPSNLNESVRLNNFERELKSGFSKQVKFSDRKNENLVIYKSHIASCPKATKNKIEKESSIDFNCLNLAICVDRWFMIFDFFGLVSDTEKTQEFSTKRQILPETINEFCSKLQVSIRSLNFTLLRSEALLSRVNVSNAIFIIVQEPFLKTIEGCLGSITVYDLTKFGYIYKQKFLTSGNEALNFVYKTKLSQLETLNMLDAESVLRINMSSVHYIHTKRFAVELHLFVKELLQLQTPVIKKLKKNKNDNDRNIRPSKIKLSIQADSPVIMLPASYNSNHVLVANLGQFTITNSFHLSSDECVISKKRDQAANIKEILDVMHIDLVNINLFSGECCVERVKADQYNAKDWTVIANMKIVKHGRKLFKQSCYLKLQVERNLSSDINRNCPDISVKGTFSKLNGILDLQQYKLIRGLLSYNLGESIDDVYYNYTNNFCQSIEKLSAMNQFVMQEACSNIWNLLSITILLEDVSILLILKATPKLETQSLTCIHFIKSSLEIDMFSDGSQDIDLISSNILIVDERSSVDANNVNMFRNVLQPSKKETSLSKNTVQAEIHCRKRTNSCKYTIMLNNMRVIALLDFLENLKNYLLEDPISLATVNNVPSQLVHKTQAENTESIEFVVNITDSEIIFLEQCSQIDSNAIILKSTTVISYKPNSNSLPLSININHLEIFSCSLDAEDESALSIIDPFTLNIELRNNCLSVLVHKQLNIRLSYIDMKLFTKMLRSIPSQTAQSQNMLTKTNSDFEKIAPLLAMGFDVKDCWHAMELNNWKLNESALWLAQQKQILNKNPALQLKTALLDANCISICVIDDCMDADVPLLEISFSKALLKYKFKTNQIENESSNTTYFTEGDIETEISINYYNRRLSGWEPVAEMWECTAKWKFTKTYSDRRNKFDITVDSKQLLKINITSTLIDLFKMVSKNWTSDFHELDNDNNKNSTFRQRSPFIPFALQNLTGTPLLFKPIYAQLGDLACTDAQQELIKNWISVQPNEIKAFDFIQKTKLRHVNSHQLNLHQILVQIHGWTLIGPLSIDKVGVFFRTTNFDSFYAKKTRVVFDISLIGSAQKLIKVRSALSVINKLDREILLKMVLHNDQSDNVTTISTISPHDQQCVPLKFMDASLYIKQSTTSGNKTKNYSNEIEDVGFSNHEISWKQHSGKETARTLQICHDTNKSILYTLINMSKEIYPNKEPNLPGHTITLLPPLKIKNMLCCDLIFKINSCTTGRINASESLNIYNVNISEPFNLSITLDNFQLSGQLKVPMSHIGVVEPKLKLIDIQNRELHLRISIQSFQSKSMEIYISAPVWIVNKTGLPLLYKQEGNNNIASGQFDEHEKARQVSPLMFSFSDQEGSPALEVRLGNAYGSNNPWCKSFSIHKHITYRELRAEHSKGCYAIGIRVRRGRGLYACTTFVTLSPRFQLHNKSGYKLEFAQKCDINKADNCSSQNVISAPIDCNFPFHWPNRDQEPLICVRIANVEFCCWSKGIPINEVQSLYINVRNEWSEMFFLRLEVISKGATYILLFTDARSLPPPIRIDNCSEVVITFSQMGSKPHWPSPVRPQSSLSYAMDDPLGVQTLLLEAPGGNIVEFPVNKTNISKSLTYSNFIYIAFQKTFEDDEIPYQQLVLGVRDKRVIIMEKNSGDRSQLWLMNSNGQLEHEGSSPPIQSNEVNAVRLVLDLEKPPNPNELTMLVVRVPNKQRMTTQTWRFENGRLMCHANMCVQAFGGLDGLRPNSEAVLGRIEYSSHSRKSIPIEQFIVAQKLRPGSGQLEISTKMDGPICTVQIRDIKMKLNEIFLSPDLLWTHASLNNRQTVDEGKQQAVNEYLICLELPKGIGISIITRKPCEEIMYISLDHISADIMQSTLEKSLDINISYIQIDNQLLDAVSSVALHSCKTTEDDPQKNALVLKLKTLPSPNKSAVIFKYLTLDMKPCIAYIEERLILKVASFLGYGKLNIQNSNVNLPYELQMFEEEKLLLKDMKRYYFENFSIGSTQVRLSALTSSKLPVELQETKKVLGLTLIKFEDALIELDKFSDKYHFETMDVYLRAMKIHYTNQIKWHAASILGSVDFLGNPLGFANDLSEGVSGLLFEGSVKSLVKNVTHGISNSTAKLTETLSDSLGRVVLDDHDNETRQRILELQSNTSSGHLAAGIKGFGFGLLGGVTSIVRHTYDGAQADGVPGFLSGLGKGLVGTVTKPIIGMLDLASETASAVRETSRGTHRNSPDRKRMPRCVTGAPGGLLPAYSSRQSKGQQYLYIINRRNFMEKIISYEPNLWSNKDARLRLLVSTEFVRVFSICDENPTITFECHLSEILSCHPLVTNTGSQPSTSQQVSASYYIEISINLPKITRPRFRCRTEESADAASRCINYAKSVFDEREHTLCA